MLHNLFQFGDNAGGNGLKVGGGSSSLGGSMGTAAALGAVAVLALIAAGAVGTGGFFLTAGQPEHTAGVLVHDLFAHLFGQIHGRIVGQAFALIHERMGAGKEHLVRDHVLDGVDIGVLHGSGFVFRNVHVHVLVAIADCGFTSIWDIFDEKINKVINIPGNPILTSANNFNKIISGFDFKKASAVEQLKKATVPTLFIHGEEDTFVPFEMLQKLYDAAACEKAMVTIPEAPHARNSIVNPELYWSNVDEFIKKHVK